MKLKILVVDDSLFMRTLISDILNSDPQINVVDTAKSGTEALEKIPHLKPNVVTLDIVMPGMDGLSTLKHIMDQHPIPVVMLSAYSHEGADITMECLNAGAVGYVLKPSGELSLDIEKVKEDLLAEVKAAASANIRKIKLIKGRARPKRKVIAKHKIVVIGASTGGTQTITAILSSLPKDFAAPILVIQHMPSRFFTQSFAENLGQNCELEVKVAEHNEVFSPGRVYLVPSKEGAKDITPSVDKTMQSVAKIYNGNTLGIVLTGMGKDGVEGMKAIKENNGQTIVQDESALINGMPQAVRDAGYADKVLSLEEISNAIVEFAGE